MKRRNSSQKRNPRSLSNTRTNGVGSEMAVVNSRYTISTGSTGSSGENHVFLQITPSSSYVNPVAVCGIAASYEFYRVRSMSAEFVPTAGSTQAGTVYSAFINNPALAVAVTNGTLSSAQVGQVVVNTQGSRFTGATTPMTHVFQMNRPVPRKWFSTSVPATNDTDVVERCVETLFAWYTSGPAGSVLGAWRFNIVYEFRSLGSSSIAGDTFALAASGLGPDPLRVPYPLREGKPKSIELYAIGDPTAYYVPRSDPTPPKPDEDVTLGI